MTDDMPREIDKYVLPRVNVKTAAKYLARSERWVQKAIRSGVLPAIDTAPDGAPRPCWSVAIRDLRAFTVKCEMRAERRLAEAQANEPDTCE